jgi:hypothetical protein
MYHYNVDCYYEGRDLFKSLKLDNDTPFIDRYNTIPHYIPAIPYSVPAEYDASFNKSFSWISSATASIILSQGKKVNVFWSGGLDSTCALVALIANCNHKDQIRILCTYNSIIESGSFYETFLKEYETTIDISGNNILFNENELYITGAPGNQLFETGAYDIENMELHRLKENYKTVFSKEKLNLYEHAISLSPRPIVTAEDFLWFEGFAFKWDNQRFATMIKWLKPKSIEKYLDKIIGFYYNKDYEIWSIQNNEQKYDIKNVLTTNKMPMRKYILSMLGEKARVYCENKHVARSMFIPFYPTYRYISTDLKVHYDTSL